MESWEDSLTEEQRIRVNEAKKVAQAILNKNIPLNKKLKLMRKRFKKRWG